MSETWVVCASCGLRRRARAGGSCTRCHSTEALPTVAAPMMVAPTMEAPEVATPTMVAPAMVEVVAPKREAPAKPVLIVPVRVNAMRTPASLIVQDGSPLRWAGALLLGGVLLSLVEMGLLRAQFLIDGDQLGGRFAVVVIDAILGALLLLGQEKYRQLASVRAMMGGVMFTLMHVIEGHTLLAAGQLLNSAILVTLLAQEPLRDRVRLALGAALGLFLLQSVGIHLMIKHKQSAFAAERNLRRMESLQRFAGP